LLVVAGKRRPSRFHSARFANIVTVVPESFVGKNKYGYAD